MIRSTFLLFPICLLGFIACKNPMSSKSTADMTLSRTQEDKIFNTDKAENDLVAADTVAQFAPPGNTPAKHEDWDKKIIKTGDIQLEVKNYDDYNNRLHEFAKQFGAYVASEEQNQSDYKKENQVTIKVPVDQFENAVNAMLSLGGSVLQKKIKAEDAGGEIVDIKARMEAKKRIRDRYSDFLRQAKNISEVMQVQTEIDGIQETIESAAGRLEYLRHATAYSTIHCNFYQVLNAKAAPEDPSFGQRLVKSLKDGFNVSGEVLLAVSAVWPLWIILALAWVFLRRNRPARKNSSSAM